MHGCFEQNIRGGDCSSQASTPDHPLPSSCPFLPHSSFLWGIGFVNLLLGSSPFTPNPTPVSLYVIPPPIHGYPIIPWCVATGWRGLFDRLGPNKDFPTSTIGGTNDSPRSEVWVSRPCLCTYVTLSLVSTTRKVAYPSLSLGSVLENIPDQRSSLVCIE